MALNYVTTMDATETHMTFSQALDLLKAGKTVRRSGWAPSGASIHLISNLQSDSGIALAPCVCWCVPGKIVQPGWLCSQADMLADDWVSVPSVLVD